MITVRPTRGFTIVEVLIVISVIGILAAIGVVSWNGVATASRDRARENDTRQWAGTFDLYKSRYAVWPALPPSDGTAPPQAVWLCLGEFVGDKCVQVNGVATQYISDTASSQLFTNVKKMGNLPTNAGPSVKNQYAGPFVYIWQSTSAGTVTLNAKFFNFFENSCPSGLTRETTDPAPSPPFTSLLVSIPNTVYVCWIQKTMTYTSS